MVSIKILEDAGFTASQLKKKFTKSDGQYDPKIKTLLDLIQSRILAGRTLNLNTYQTFAAIDAAYNASYGQEQIALIQSIVGNAFTGTAEQACQTCRDFGLTADHLFAQELGPDNKPIIGLDGKPKLRIKTQNFFRVLVTLVKAYITVRWGKLFTDRDLYPLFKFSPISYTADKRALCEVITDLIQRQTTDFGYSTNLKQDIFQQLLYGFMVMFPKEPWYRDTQLTDEEEYTVVKGDSLRKIADRFDVTDAKLRAANPKRKGGVTIGEVLTIPERETCVKQGIRYDTPHPTRCFFDLAEPTNTINTDTGVRYGAYWRVDRYGALMDDPDLWNKDDISFGQTDWFNWAGTGGFWSQVYPCAMRFPTGIFGARDMQRERSLVYLTNTDQDAPVFLTNIVMKINPKTYGLADYDYPVWVRFIVANDNTVLWCDLFPYAPMLYCGYDADNNRWPNASMALEILPFQVQMGNILSQILFTAKQNLYNVVPYDTNQIEPETIRELENRGDAAYGGIVFLKYDSLKAKFAAAAGPRDMFQPINLGQHSSAEMTGQIAILIDILERLLGMSSQEVGSAASHEQSATETRVIAENSGIRVRFTGSFVDDMIKAWKNQLYYASMAFMDDEFISQVNPTPETMDALKKMGFDVPEDFPTSNYGQDKVQIRGKKKHLVLDGFASDRDGANRINDPGVAAVLLQGVQTIVQNPLLMQSVGAQPLLDLLTRIVIMAGGPADTKFKVDPKASAEAQAQQIQAAVQQVSGEIMKSVLQQVGDGIKPLAEAIKQGQQGTQQLAQQTSQALEQLSKQLEGVTAGLIENSKRDQQFAQVSVAAKQEADQTAQALLEMQNILKQIVSHVNPGAMQPEQPVSGNDLPIQPQPQMV